MKLTFTIILLISIQSISCSQESQFASGSSLKYEPSTSDDASPILSGEDLVSTISDEHIDYQYEKAIFQFGAKSKPVDYLFVIDNSVSMSGILSQVQQGFSSLEGSNIFPDASKIAVMTTMIGDNEDYSLPHPLLSTYSGMKFEPGFLDLVNKNSIERFRDEVPSRANSYLQDACPEKWFQPGDTNNNKISCLSAAIQSTLFRVGAEAGILAFQQLIIKNANQPTFRDDARVNVIFVSDTHDPGLNEQELVDQRMSFSELGVLVGTYNNVSSLKFHAMAPASRCTGEGLFDLSYFKLVDNAGGEKGDICTTNDYSDFLKAMVASSQEQEPKFIMKNKIKEVLKVRVDGVEVSNYSIDEDLQSVIIDGLDPNVPATIEIIYASYGDDSEIGLASEH